MAVENKITKIKKRSGVRVPFRQERITRAILRAARSIGGFAQDILPNSIYDAFKDHSDREIAELLSDDVVMCLNANKAHLSRDSVPDVEVIQDHVVHVLRSRGFVDVADVYEVYRWGKTKIREGEFPPELFSGNGYPEEKIAQILEWNREHECETVLKLNSWVLSGRFKELVDASIAAYEADLDEAVRAFQGKGNVRVLLISGPSSSGKTTTTFKLAQRLARLGFKLRALNLDNYFLGLSEYSQDQFGDWDFETPHALQIDLINQHLADLLEGKTIRSPRYDFKRGRSIPEAIEVSIAEDEILLLDSHHGLYPPMTASVPEEMKFKIYVETLNMLLVGDGSSGVTTKWTDIRLLRRMLRDRDHRNHSPEMTLGHWHFVRKGELQDIIPYIRTVDVVINGGLAFELPALRTAMGDDFPDPEKFLRQGRLDAYIRGERVKRLLASVVAQPDISPAVIPEDCHLREFIGGINLPVHG
jgi:uridine kinase